MWDPSTIAIAPEALDLHQALGQAAPRRCSLVVYSGSDLGHQVTLDEGVHTIGRSAAAQLQVDDPGMSRLHATLRVQGDEVWLHDLGSVNGSFVHERRLDGPTRLRDGDLLRLGSVVLKFYGRHSLDAALHDRVYRLAMTDAGTGVCNRRHLQQALRRAMRAARRSGQPLALIAYDLDRFKSVNDRLGHAAGDQVLRESAALVQRALAAAAPEATLARLGGEEFALLLPGWALGDALALAERLRAAVAGHDFLLSAQHGSPLPTVHRQTVSLGVAVLCDEMVDGGDLLDAADRQLYRAKHEGRDRVCG